MSAQKTYTFFIGAHRTGSKAMAQFTSGLDDTYCVHQQRSHQILNLVTFVYLNKLMPRFVFNKLADVLLINRLIKSDAAHVVETNGYNMVALQRALDVLPNVKVIHVTRDPRTFIRSMRNWRAARPGKDKIQERLPFWDAGPRLLDEISAKEWKQGGDAFKFAQRWHYKNKLITAKYANLPNYKRCKFEDLFDPDKSEQTLKLLRWAGLELNIEDVQAFIHTKVNVSGAGNQGTWDDWTTADAQAVTQICFPNAYGYKQDQAWIDKSEQGE